jgi:HlyD family secretion protein
VQQSASVDAQQAAIGTAEADLSAQQATVASAAASLKTAQANLAQARAKLKQSEADFARNQQAFKDQLISRQVFDQSLSDHEVAQANVQSAQAQVEQSKALYQQATYNRDMARARLAQSHAQLLGFKNQLAQTVYTSPLDGVITALPIHLGENVVPGIQNATGSVLFQVSDLSVITAEVKVDETDIVNVKLAQPADVTIDAIPNKTFKGRVTEIGQAAVSRTTGQTTTATTSTTNTTEEAKDFKVVVTLDSPPPGLRPGLSTTAKITTATRQNVVTIPIQALTIRTRRELEADEKQASGKALAAEKQPAPPPSAKEREREKEELQGVFVVRNGVAKFVQVETGIMGATDVEIVKGLQPGDQIVTGSFQVLRTLKSNAKVKVEKTPPPGGAPAPS